MAEVAGHSHKWPDRLLRPAVGRQVRDRNTCDKEGVVQYGWQAVTHGSTAYPARSHPRLTPAREFDGRPAPDGALHLGPEALVHVGKLVEAEDGHLDRVAVEAQLELEGLELGAEHDLGGPVHWPRRRPWREGTHRYAATLHRVPTGQRSFGRLALRPRCTHQEHDQ